MVLAAFLGRFCTDLRDAQDAQGRFPIYAPRLTGQGSAPAWADAGVVLPWRVYQNYGDRRLLAVQYEAARRWVEHACSLNPDLIWRQGRGDDFGDWLNADTFALPSGVTLPKVAGAVPNKVFATAFFAHSTDLLERMARVLGKDQDAARYAEQFTAIAAAFNRAFVAPDGTVRLVLLLNAPGAARPRRTLHLQPLAASAGNGEG
jgi:alpha-L-rhamnosidase